MGPAVKGNGPSLKSLQMFLLGDTLQFTILRNCIDLRTLQQTGGGLGVPVWESAPDNNFLARLAPVHCSLWLSDDLSTTLLAPGYEYPQYEAYRDPYATTLTRKNKRQLLRAEQGKAIWRDLHLLINIQHAEGISGPLNLQAFNSRCNYIENTELWVGELIKDRDAKILDAIESTFTVTHQLFSDLGHNIYQAGVDFAERVAVQLVKSVKAYWLNLTELNQKNTTNCRKPNPLIAKAEKHYWHRLDQEHRTLIQLAGDPRARVGQPGFGETGADDHWTELVRKAALEAYRAVCPQTTPRQIQAHANGIKILLRVLYPKVKKQKTATA